MANNTVAGIIDATNAFTWVSGNSNPGPTINYRELSNGDVLTYNGDGGSRQSIVVEDNDSSFYTQDSGQKTVGSFTIDGTTHASGKVINLNYRITFEDTATGETYTVYAGGLGTPHSNPPTSFYMWATGTGAPPAGANLVVTNEAYATAVPYSSITCFAAGTMIATAQGEIPVEALRPGDRVVTCDGDCKPLRQALSCHVDAAALRHSPNLYPIRIKAGALGQDLPGRDLLVSRQHRMLVRSKVAERMFGTPEVLIPACKLTDLPGIYEDRVESVDYFHLVFDAHEVIFAEGAPSESFYPGPEAMKALQPEQREEFYRLFPELECGDVTPKAARVILEGRRQRALVRRMAKNHKPVLAA